MNLLPSAKQVNISDAQTNQQGDTPRLWHVPIADHDLQSLQFVATGIECECPVGVTTGLIADAQV